MSTTIYVLSRNMKNIRILSETFQFSVVKFSIYLNWRVFVMIDLLNRNRKPANYISQRTLTQLGAKSHWKSPLVRLGRLWHNIWCQWDYFRLIRAPVCRIVSLLCCYTDILSYQQIYINIFIT